MTDGRINLTSVKQPESLTEIGAEAFAGCRRLTSANVPKSLADVGEMAFKGCPVESVFSGNCGDEGDDE